jgi:hypothetical protein
MGVPYCSHSNDYAQDPEATYKYISHDMGILVVFAFTFYSEAKYWSTFASLALAFTWSVIGFQRYKLNENEKAGI